MFSLNKRIMLLALLVNSFGGFFPLHAKRNVAHVTTPEDQVVNEGQRQLTKIRICLNSISALIKKNQTYSKELQDQIIDHFILLDGFIIERLHNEKFIHADLANAYGLLQINNVLINHINHLMSSNFKDVAAFNMQDFIKKTAITRDVLQPEEILKRLIENNKKLDALTKRALGLTWYNKLTRSIDDYIITPIQKYDLLSRGGLGLGTLFFSSLLFWQMNPKYVAQLLYYKQPDSQDPTKLVPININTFQNSDGSSATRTQRLLHSIGRFYGMPSHRSVDAQDAEGIVGTLDNFVGRLIEGHAYTAKAVGGLLLTGYLTEFHHTIYPKLKKQFEIRKNNLMGGIHVKEAQRISEKVDHVRFKDIFGQDEIKRFLQLIVDYLEDPETFDRLGLTPPTGILFIGDTRTGKTFTISALYGEINDMLQRTNQSNKFKLIKLDEVTIKFEGMEKILRTIRKDGPCIVFIDEIDLLDLQRTGENRTLSQFLTAMGETIGSKDTKKRVIVIAATNRPETLDVALRQPGRFGKELRFEYPNYQDRYKFIQAKLKEFSLTIDQFNVTSLAQYTENKSYEAMNMFIKNAIIKARIRGEMLSQAHLDEALDEDIYHIIPKYTKNIPTEELKILAAHFAGQALFLSHFDNHINLAKVTIKQVMTELKEEVMGMHLYTDKHKKEQQRFEYGRIFTHHQHDSINMNTRDEKVALCTMYLAGFIAEELLLGSCSYSCHADDDMANAMHIAQSIAFEGLDTNTMPKPIKLQKENEALAIIEQCKKSARETLINSKAQLQLVADALLEHKTLDHDQVMAIIKDSPKKESLPIEQVALAA